jgi:hypothetical protein
MDPLKSITNVKSADFKEKIQDIKKDGKDNLVAVDKDTGNVTIYTFDQKIPSEFKQGLAKTNLVFEDLGSDDALATNQEINRFIYDVQKAGSKFNPESFFNDINNKIPAFKNDMNEKINIMNISNNINNQLEKFSEALKNNDVPEIKKWSGILTQTSKQIALDRFYVADQGQVMSLGRNEYKLAAELREITFNTDTILKKIEEDNIKTGIK